MTSRSIKQFLAAGGAALVLGGAALGVAAAQQTPTPQAQSTPTRPPGAPVQPPGAPRPDQHRELLNRVAGKLGVAPERVQQAFEEARRELGIPDRPAGPLGGGFVRRGPGFDLATAAQAMNIQPDQLFQELPGRTLSDVARARNVDPTVVANALKAQASQRIDQAASAGRIPADQVAAAKQNANQRVDELMNRQFPAAGQRRGPGGPGEQRAPGLPRVPGATNQPNSFPSSAFQL
jgi:hypothetical protein